MIDKPQEYLELIEAIAEEIVDSDPDFDRDKLIHEAADGSEWTFKDFKARLIAWDAENPNGGTFASRAYEVMRRDIEREIARIEEGKVPVEHEFTLRVNIKRTVETEEYDTVTIFASSVEEAKERAERECRNFENPDRFEGGTLVGIECDLEGLVDEETGEEYDSLGIDPGDDKPFTEED